MTQTVKTPDGTIHNFPDEATPDQMKKALSPKSAPKIQDKDPNDPNFKPSWSGLASAAGEDLSNIGHSLVDIMIPPRPGDIDQSASKGLGAAMMAVGMPGVKPLIGSAEALASVLANKIPSASQRNLKSFDSSPVASDFRKLADSSGLEINGKNPKEIQDSVLDFFKTKSRKVQEHISPSGEKFDPIKANREISKTYHDEIEHSQNLYSGAKAAFRGTKVTDNGLSADLDSLIEELKTTPEVMGARTSASKAARDLGDVRKKLSLEPKDIVTEGVSPEGIKFKRIEKETNPQIEVNDLIDLKKSLNKSYDPTSFRTSEDAPYIRLSKKIDQLIREGGRKNQYGMKQYEAANQHWRDEVSNRFHENKILEQFWKPEDYNLSFKNDWAGTPVANQVGLGVHPNTAARVESFMKKLNSPLDLEIVANSLPLKYSRVVYANKFADIVNDIGLDASKLTPEKLTMIEKTLSKGYGAPQARQAVSDMKKVMEALYQRNIKAPYTEAELARQNKNIARYLGDLWSVVASVKSGNPASMLRSASEALTKEEADKAAGAKMKALLDEYQARVKPNAQR